MNSSIQSKNSNKVEIQVPQEQYFKYLNIKSPQKRPRVSVANICQGLTSQKLLNLKSVQNFKQSIEIKESNKEYLQNFNEISASQISSSDLASDFQESQSYEMSNQDIENEGKYEQHMKNHVKNLSRKINIDLNIDQDLEGILYIMNKDKNNKSISEIQILRKAVKNVEFFKQAEKEMDEKIINKLLQNFSHQFLNRRQVLFSEGDVGMHFYFILRGNVKILQRVEKEDNQKKPLTQKQIRKFNKLEDEEYYQYMYSDCKIIGEIGQVGSFGEIALRQSCQRTATVICSEDCHFAIIDRQTYMKCVNQYEENFKELQFLKQIPLINFLLESDLEQLRKSMTKKTYPINHYIYKQGDIANLIYFIEKGEIVTSRYSDVISDNPNEVFEERLKIMNKQQAIEQFVKQNNINNYEFNKSKLKNTKLQYQDTNKQLNQIKLKDKKHSLQNHFNPGEQRKQIQILKFQEKSTFGDIETCKGMHQEDFSWLNPYLGQNDNQEQGENLNIQNNSNINLKNNNHISKKHNAQNNNVFNRNKRQFSAQVVSQTATLYSMPLEPLIRILKRRKLFYKLNEIFEKYNDISLEPKILIRQELLNKNQNITKKYENRLYLQQDTNIKQEYNKNLQSKSQRQLQIEKEQKMRNSENYFYKKLLERQQRSFTVNDTKLQDQVFLTENQDMKQQNFQKQQSGVQNQNKISNNNFSNIEKKRAASIDYQNLQQKNVLNNSNQVTINNRQNNKISNFSNTNLNRQRQYSCNLTNSQIIEENHNGKNSVNSIKESEENSNSHKDQNQRYYTNDLSINESNSQINYNLQNKDSLIKKIDININLNNESLHNSPGSNTNSHQYGRSRQNSLVHSILLKKDKNKEQNKIINLHKNYKPDLYADNSGFQIYKKLLKKGQEKEFYQNGKEKQILNNQKWKQIDSTLSEIKNIKIDVNENIVDNKESYRMMEVNIMEKKLGKNNFFDNIDNVIKFKCNFDFWKQKSDPNYANLDVDHPIIEYNSKKKDRDLKQIFNAKQKKKKENLLQKSNQNWGKKFRSYSVQTKQNIRNFVESSKEKDNQVQMDTNQIYKQNFKTQNSFQSEQKSSLVALSRKHSFNPAKYYMPQNQRYEYFDLYMDTNDQGIKYIDQKKMLRNEISLKQSPDINVKKEENQKIQNLNESIEKKLKQMKNNNKNDNQMNGVNNNYNNVNFYTFYNGSDQTNDTKFLQIPELEKVKMSNHRQIKSSYNPSRKLSAKDYNNNKNKHMYNSLNNSQGNSQVIQDSLQYSYLNELNNQMNSGQFLESPLVIKSLKSKNQLKKQYSSKSLYDKVMDQYKSHKQKIQNQNIDDEEFDGRVENVKKMLQKKDIGIDSIFSDQE